MLNGWEKLRVFEQVASLQKVIHREIYFLYKQIKKISILEYR